MLVPVMRVREMGVLVNERRVLVAVGMRGTCRNRKLVQVLMVFIVDVFVFVHDRSVAVFVPMVLCEV